MPHTDIVSAERGLEMPECFDLPATARPERLDKVLARLMPQHSRNRLQSWIEGGHVQVDGAPGRVRTSVGPGAHIRVWPQPAPEDLAFVAEAVDFEVVAEAPEWIVVNKPAGLVTHPGAGNWGGTLLNGLLLRYPELARVPRAGIVHRLDKDTSGLLVVARTPEAQTHLVRQLQARTVTREYRALVHGHLAAGGTVDAAIGRDAHVPVRMTTIHPVAPRRAVTHYAVVAIGSSAGIAVTEIACRLETGRTHQIRVHMALLRHPLLGDVLYGGQHVLGACRQMLHARVLGFEDPGGGGPRLFTIPVPADFCRVRDQIVWG